MINKFAFTYIAVYGVSFCDAASDVWELIKERGFDLIINDDITENVYTRITVCFSCAHENGMRAPGAHNASCHRRPHHSGLGWPGCTDRRGESMNLTP